MSVSQKLDAWSNSKTQPLPWYKALPILMAIASVGWGIYWIATSSQRRAESAAEKAALLITGPWDAVRDRIADAVENSKLLNPPFHPAIRGKIVLVFRHSTDDSKEWNGGTGRFAQGDKGAFPAELGGCVGPVSVANRLLGNYPWQACKQDTDELSSLWARTPEEVSTAIYFRVLKYSSTQQEFAEVFSRGVRLIYLQDHSAIDTYLGERPGNMYSEIRSWILSLPRE
jgi:hypothetical protein